MNPVRKSLMRHSPSLAACTWSAAIVVGSLIAALFSHAADPATPAAQPAAKTFRLADGSEIPIEQYGETYETLEWRPPIDPKKAKVIADYNFDSGSGTASIALDLQHKRIYWFLGGGRHSVLMRANLDGSGRKKLLDELATPDGMKEIEGARQINVAPELKKIFWVCLGRKPDPSGHSIYEADLDGKNPKSIVTGLHCTCLIVDSTNKKMYYNDDKTILRSNLDGTGTEELGAKSHSPFAIDFNRRLIFAEHGRSSISKQSFDGSGHEILYECSDLGTTGLSIVLDEVRGELYWLAQESIARAPVEDLYRFEELVDTSPFHPPFAVDTSTHTLYWLNKNGNLLSAHLPPPRMPVTKSAPPLITGFGRADAAYGDEITIQGSGLSQCRRLFWIGAPTAKFVEGKILSMSNDSIAAKIPDLGPDCALAHAVLVGDNGTTVTLSHDTTPLRKYLQMTRSLADKRFPLLIYDKSLLQNVENRLVFVLRGGQSVDGVRGGNICFVKNGGIDCPIKQPGVVFHEPHARITECNESVVRISTPAIRASFVEQLLIIKH